MNFVFNSLGRGFLYTIGKALAIIAIIVLLGLLFSRFPKQNDYNNYDYLGGYLNEK